MSLHGGADALGAARWDFSTNANACGPEPGALHAVRTADATRYPDPGYTRLCEALGALHGVEPRRIVVAASASEFIVRMTTAVAIERPGARVHAPRPGYADYARAAHALGLSVDASAAAAQLVWHTEPGSPCGESQALPASAADAVCVVDRAYAPLQLDGAREVPASAWQLWSPNKALGLTGMRGAYAVAPVAADRLGARLEALAPSWPLGAHGLAMLARWAEPEAQQWVRDSLATLREWKARQLDLLRGLGWTCRPSVTPFFVARWFDAAPPPGVLLPRLRHHAIKLRDAESLGLPGWVRLSVQPRDAQRALAEGWQAVVAEVGE